ncbi:hypothetical protein V6N13_128809 [Hibiscus sabdariffa]|uniref:Peptidase C14 caspase domain-containing protein n=1 Tax=Hibiscus sabdariffa TaxID=183260 RepID=A0ABR2SK55_9ROSI
MALLRGDMEIKFSCSVCRLKFSAATNAERVSCPSCCALITNQPLRGLIGLLGSWASLVSSPSLFKTDNSGDRVPVKKRALLCGVSYKKCKYELKGTINDVKNMKDLLVDMYGFQEPNILLLTEEQSDTRLIPTKANIENWLKWLVKNCRSGDSLVFYYSGHGLRQPDFDNEESDEAICPVSRFTPLSTLAIAEPSSVSSTSNKQKGKWIENSPPSGVRKQTSGGLAYSISAFEDDQVAADTSASNSKTINGAMTFVLIEAVRGRGQRNITYGELLDEMEDRIEQANQQGCLGGSRILARLFGPNLTQKPLLSASEEFPVYKREFKL